MSRPSEPGVPVGAGRLPTVSPGTVRRLSVASMVAVVLIVLTGAAVRLTGSGLGCPDWPSCYRRQVTPQLAFHPVVEFSNRLVTVVLTVLVAVTFLAALRRRPFRRDLVWLSIGLLAGVIAQAVIGGIAVYTKLNPYVVLLHFLASMLLVAVSVLLVRRSSRTYGPRTATVLVPRPILHAAKALLALLAVVLLAGTFTTGSGPHAGNAHGQLAARRIPIALRDIAELHSTLAILLVGLAVGLAIALHATPSPERVRRAGRVLCVVLMAQAAIGYTQYFTHLPAALVEIHVLGATALVVGGLQLFLSMTDHPREITVSQGQRADGSLEETDAQRVGVGGW